MSRPHPAQIRLLSFLAQVPAGGFVALAHIDRARPVRPGDDLFVPSLVARGWAEMGPRHQASVRITEAGRDVLIGSSDHDHDHTRRRDNAEDCGEI